MELDTHGPTSTIDRVQRRSRNLIVGGALLFPFLWLLVVDSRFFYFLPTWRVVWSVPGFFVSGILLFVLPSIGLGLVTAGVALRKGRSFWLWFTIGFFLGFIGLIVSLVIKLDPDRKVEQGLKKCPHCGEWVGRTESQCRYCLGVLVTPGHTSSS